jgi:dissimilatory sulfite reductase (desulfoviridin) alpha/beta subunit
MVWTPEAEAYLKKVPFFVRKKVKREVEKYLQERGKKRITLEELLEAKEALLSKMSEAEKGYEVSGCFGVDSCPNALTASSHLLSFLEKILEEEKLTQFLASKVGPKLKAHHKFKVCLSECPNACSQVHICDFALHGVVKISVNPKACSFCGSCVEVCEESAIELTEFGPTINEELCVGCGHCLKVCPESALSEEFRGYKVYLGGKLGRHPRLATFLDYYKAEDIPELLRKVLYLYKKHNQKGERLGAIIERLSWERFVKELRDLV